MSILLGMLVGFGILAAVSTYAYFGAYMHQWLTSRNKDK